jgi:tryptophanyl-tRNA synthetase
MKRPLLLAGTRVTGPTPHLGTFYGWLRPVAAAARSMDVCVLVADMQSLDVNHDDGLTADTDRLVAALAQFLPSNVAIVRESGVPSIPLLALYASTEMAGHQLRRIGPLRKLAASGQPITLPSLLYPAMMIANVLAFGATHILAKPEGRFQHHNVLNDVLHRAARTYGWPEAHLTAHPKPRIDLPGGDGSGPMKRNRPGALFVDASDSAVQTWAAGLPAPETANPSQRATHCQVVLPTWRAVIHDQPRRYQRIERACRSGALDCDTCRISLARSITTDLRAARMPAADSGTAIAERAEQQARSLVRRATGKRFSRKDGQAEAVSRLEPTQ